VISLRTGYDGDEMMLCELISPAIFASLLYLSLA